MSGNTLLQLDLPGVPKVRSGARKKPEKHEKAKRNMKILYLILFPMEIV